MIDELKGYLKIDGSEEDVLLTSLIGAAETYMLNAGVIEKQSDLYKLGVFLFVSKQYSGDSDGKKEKALENIIMQLRY